MEPVAEVMKRLQSRVTGGGSDHKKFPRNRFVAEFFPCQTHGEVQINFQASNGSIRFVPGGCPTCQRQAQIDAMLTRSAVSARFRDKTFDNYEAVTVPQRKALTACKDYADTFGASLDQGRCMILMGNPGTGKNHLAAAIVKSVIGQMHSALMTKAPDLVEAYWAKGFAEREAWFYAFRNVDLLVIDEVGRSSQGKAAQDFFFRLIDLRSEAKLPTILLTNLDRARLVEHIGEAAFDRLREGGGERLVFDWESHRPGKSQPQLKVA